MADTLKDRALEYHQYPRPGKTSVAPTKPTDSVAALSLAYTPGVAEPVLEIAANPADVYRYTNKGNLVAVISNGTAILGLGNRGPLASKPVMEGKAVLFKKFADIDVFDIEVAETDPDKFVECVAKIAPTFGGINLEDIAAPQCFVIEQKLQALCDIPVFHDDQHGTAIIIAAGLTNALRITGRQWEEVKAVFSGAGAAALAAAQLLVACGLKKENIILVDSTGVIFRGRTENMNEYKSAFAATTPARTLAEALVGADVFIGVSQADVVTPEMLKTMAARPIVFALANPNPEISYPLAKQARPDVIMATGRSDFPNQINNVLGFPSIFRGALDVGAKHITQGMKLAAAAALAELAVQPALPAVEKLYDTTLTLGPEYIVPKPFDPRVIQNVALAVAKAAVADGVATKPIADWNQYAAELADRTSVAGLL